MPGWVLLQGLSRCRWSKQSPRAWVLGGSFSSSPLQGEKKNGVGKRRCSSGREMLGRGPSFAGVLGGGRFAAAPSPKSSSSFPAHPAPGMVPAREGARLGARTWRDLATKEIGCQLMPVYKDICHPELGTSGEEVRARIRTAGFFLFFFIRQKMRVVMRNPK